MVIRIHKLWPRIATVLTWTLLILIVARFLSEGLVRVTWNIGSDAIDQGSYLQLGLFIREGRAFTDGNRTPLYPALLALFARREWAYFTEAKLMGLGIGLAGLGLVYVLSRRCFGTGVALASILLLSTNDHYQMDTSWVASEALLLILFFLTWYLVVTGFQDRRRWLGAGIVAGLAALTKGTGQLLMVAFLMALPLTQGRRALREKWAYAALLGYIVVVSPLWAINLRVFGDPLYNYNTTHALWFDDWEDAYIVGRPPATMGSYLRTHSLSEMAERGLYGLRKVADVWTTALWPHIANPVLTPIAGKGRTALFVASAVVALLLLSLVWRRGRWGEGGKKMFRGGAVFTLILCALVYVSFSWYAQVIYKARFVSPLNGILYVSLLSLLSVAARPALTWARKQAFLPTLGRAGVGLLALAVAAVLGYSAVTAIPRWRNPYQVDLEANLPREDVLQWVVAQTEPGERVLFGPSHSLPGWMVAPRLEFVSIPIDLDSWSEMEAYVHSQGIRYWLLDFWTIGRREPLLRPYFDRHEEQVVFKQLPPRWEVVYADRKFIFDYVCLRVYPEGQEGPPMEPLSQVSIGPQIELLGYRIAPEDTPSGQGVDLALYWRARERVERNYKVFTHLLRPDGTLHSQHDGEPLYGFWPTGAWLPGQTVVDHHPLPLGEGTPPGAYRLEVGLYDGETMARLPVSDGSTGQVVADHLILPATVPVE